MAQNKECIAAIDQQPGVQFYLNKMFSRPEASIDSHAKTLLYHINEFKTMNMNRFMPQDNMGWNALQTV